MVNCVIQLTDGTLVSGSDDATIKQWNIKTGECLRTLEGHTNDVSCLWPMMDGRVMSGSTDKSARIWNMKTGETEMVIEQTSPVSSLCQLTNGQVVMGLQDGTVALYR